MFDSQCHKCHTLAFTWCHMSSFRVSFSGLGGFPRHRAGVAGGDHGAATIATAGPGRWRGTLATSVPWAVLGAV